MKTNVATVRPLQTFEGGPAVSQTPLQELRRAVLTSMLFEDCYYESGQAVAERIAELVPKCRPYEVMNLAIEARSKFKLRHVPLWLMVQLAKHPSKDTNLWGAVRNVIQRADEMGELLALYWKDGKKPIPKQFKKGLDAALRQFNEYDLAKYGKGAISVKDILRLIHPTPTAEHAELWGKVIKGELATPDTWEVGISAAKGDPEATRLEWIRLLSEGRLGALALIRNLRNIREAGVDLGLVRSRLETVKADRVLPYRWLTAARYAPELSDILEKRMLECLAGMPKLPGSTAILVDVSGSMDVGMSGMSEVKRYEVASGLAVMARELCENVAVGSFSSETVLIPAHYRGFALAEAIDKSQLHRSTYLGRAVAAVDPTFDRIIVITDEQAHDSVGCPVGRGYMINVAPHKPSVGFGKWNRINGFSEAIFDYIMEVEREG